MATPELPIGFNNMIAWNMDTKFEENVSIELLQFYPEWVQTRTRTLCAIERAQAEIDSKNSKLNKWNFFRSATSIATNTASFAYPPVAIIGLFQLPLWYMQRSSICECRSDIQKIKEAIEEDEKATAKLEDLMNSQKLSATKGISQQKMQETQKVLSEFIDTIIEKGLFKRLPGTEKTMEFIKEKLVSLFSYIFACSFNEDVKSLIKLTEDKVNLLYSELKTICEREGYFLFLIELISNDDVRNTALKLMRSLFFKIMLQTYKNTKDIYQALMEGIKCLRNWIILTPGLPTGFNMLLGVNEVSKQLKLVKNSPLIPIESLNISGKSVNQYQVTKVYVESVIQNGHVLENVNISCNSGRLIQENCSSIQNGVKKISESVCLNENTLNASAKIVDGRSVSGSMAKESMKKCIAKSSEIAVDNGEVLKSTISGSYDQNIVLEASLNGKKVEGVSKLTSVSGTRTGGDGLKASIVEGNEKAMSGWQFSEIMETIGTAVKVGVIAYDLYSLYGSCLNLVNGSKTEQGKCIEALRKALIEDENEKTKMYDAFFERSN